MAAPRPAASNRRAAAIVAIAFLAGVSLVAGASAQLDIGEEVDTRYTPVAKDTTAWIKIAGAGFGEETVPSDSPTPVHVDFYTVAFESDLHGFAGGARCREAPPGGLTGDSLREYLEECERIPVIYEYIETEIEKLWRPVYEGDGKGYVASIAFMPDGAALAVGGDGEYPRAEQTLSSAATDIAGDGRAWTYNRTFWTELGSDRMPDGMRGMTSVAMSPRVGDCPDGSQCGLAGAYRQLWQWLDGRFVKGYFPTQQDNPGNAEAGKVDDPVGFRFRVRDIEFTQTTEAGFVKAIAVTSGCCDASALNNTPRGLVFDGSTVYPREFRDQQDPSTDRDLGARREIPNSLYDIDLTPHQGKLAASMVATDGREGAETGEQPSRVLGQVEIAINAAQQPPRVGSFATPTTKGGRDVTMIDVSRVHLVASDGARAGVDPTQFHFVDWGVGHLRASGQGAAYSTETRDSEVRSIPPAPVYKVFDCPGGGDVWTIDSQGNLVLDPQCRPYDQAGYTEQTDSRQLLRLPSYALNAFAFSDPATESVGWAVGDRGAILRLGGIGTISAAAAEPTPPRLGSTRTVRFAGSEVYDAFRPLPTDAGTALVPSLVTHGSDPLERRRLVPGGAPNPTLPAHTSNRPEDVHSIVMSPDGSEGWAIGAGGNGGANLTGGNLPGAPPATTLYHYDGVRWNRCDIGGVPGLLPADPACAELEPLLNQPGGVSLTHATRIPLENDGHPENDDDFEVIAVGTNYDPAGERPSRPVIVRYRGGVWTIDEEAMRQLEPNTQAWRSVAFTSPDDGWLLSAQDQGGPTLWHWDGEEQKWWKCKDAPAECGDGGVLPLRGARTTPASLATADERVYLAANRIVGNDAGVTFEARTFPVILYKDPGGEWTAADGGYDPGSAADGGFGAAASEQGLVDTFTVAKRSDGRYVGWAVGRFGSGQEQGVAEGDEYFLLRLDGTAWARFDEDDAAADYVPAVADGGAPKPVILDAESGTAAMYRQDTIRRGFPVLHFDPDRGDRGSWRVLPTPFHLRGRGGSTSSALMRAVAPDGEGGAWLAARNAFNQNSDARAVAHFWHYDDERPRPVFEEAPHPIRESITGGAAGPDGAFWVTTNSGFVYRYDRLTGWDKLQVPGWDRGRIVTRHSEANAVAVGPDGEGLVVGKNGRIAQVSPLGVRLDPAAGKRKCGDGPSASCGTSHDLHAVAVASDGSALAAGDASVLLFRPADGRFRPIELPGGSPSITVTAISMPRPDRAWLATSAGQVFAGTRSGDGWSFAVENRGPGGKLLSLDEHNRPLALRAVQIDGQGEGYAVGKRGLILERRGDAGWQRLKTAFLDTFHSIALAPQGRAGGALIGGEMGLILTLEDGDFRVAREADLFDPLNFGDSNEQAAKVVGVALVPGLETGQVEAWAVQQPAQSGSRSAPGAVLHYTNDPNDPLLRPGSRVEPVPDAPDPRDGEISFAAFGRSECHYAAAQCPEGHAENLFHEVVSRRVADEVIDRSKEPGGPAFAVFTGDVGRAAGEEDGTGSPLDKSRVHRRWVEQIASRFSDARMPLFGAVGLNDLDRTTACVETTCPIDSKEQLTGVGPTWGWRNAMADMPLPWGAPPDPDDPDPDKRELRSGDLHFDAVEDPTGIPDPVVGQARTHYAIDLKRSDKPIARLIFLDNSMRTLASSDPNQNPIEPNGGQTEWLERMLSGVQTHKGAQAIVVMNTPTYSYVAGDPTTWAGDATVLETTLMQHDVKAVVSGRLGWNGRYWATAPGVHAPCPGDPYIEDKHSPEPGSAPCDARTRDVTDPATRASEQLANALHGLGAPPPPGEGDTSPIPGEGDGPDAGLQGLLPMVVAASAGGRFGPNGTEGGPAGSGWWHGYTIVRMDESGDPRKTIVEQRPVFDWLSITAPSHVLKPRQRMTLIGEGREPLGVDVAPRYDRLDSYAITHRYDLVMADKENPSLPARDAKGGYIPVPASVGSVDPESGRVTAGAGRQERTYTVAILSVGDKAASWPIAFEPARSFRPAASVSRVVPPTPPSNPAPSPPATVVLNQGPAPAAPPPPPPNLPPINVPPLNLPPPPAPPQLPTPTAAPPATPPPPPAPPPPPGAAGALPLSLEAPLTPVSIVPTVIPPSPPPVNPAPPSGSAARKEARQRQAATAKSEEGGGDQQGAGEGQSSGENGAAQMTRRERTRPAPSYGESSRDDGRYSFTALSHSEQPSAWSRGALYGGMTLATALALALGWGIARPTPRRRHPPRPAPETVRAVGRRPRS